MLREPISTCLDNSSPRSVVSFISLEKSRIILFDPLPALDGVWYVDVKDEMEVSSSLPLFSSVSQSMYLIPMSAKSSLEEPNSSARLMLLAGVRYLWQELNEVTSSDSSPDLTLCTDTRCLISNLSSSSSSSSSCWSCSRSPQLLPSGLVLSWSWQGFWEEEDPELGMPWTGGWFPVPMMETWCWLWVISTTVDFGDLKWSTLLYSFNMIGRPYVKLFPPVILTTNLELSECCWAFG